MLDNVDIRVALVAWLKANATIVATLTAGATEIRELSWQGEDFSYPNIRVTCSSLPNQCGYSAVIATISYFSEKKSSKEAITGQGVIAKQIHNKSFDSDSHTFSNMYVTSLPDAVREENGVWRADVIAASTIY